MSERGLHRIEDDLAETWLEDWAGAGVAEIEDYLTQHAAFLGSLEAPARRRHSPSPSERSSIPLGIAPTAFAFGWPASKRIMFGIDWIP